MNTSSDWLSLQVCKVCNIEKAAIDFYLRHKGGPRVKTCKICQYAKVRALWNPDKQRRQNKAAARWRARNNDAETKKRYAAAVLRYYYRNRKLLIKKGSIQREELSDLYVRKLLVAETALSTKAVPSELVEVKKLQLKIHRTLNEKRDPT